MDFSQFPLPGDENVVFLLVLKGYLPFGDLIYFQEEKGEVEGLYYFSSAFISK
jgi:hypothetical protein